MVVVLVVALVMMMHFTIGYRLLVGYLGNDSVILYRNVLRQHRQRISHAMSRQTPISQKRSIIMARYFAHLASSVGDGGCFLVPNGVRIYDDFRKPSMKTSQAQRL